MSSHQFMQRPFAREYVRFSLAGLTLLALSSMAAHADVSYTTSMDMSASMGNNAQAQQGGAGAPGIETTTYVKGSSERVESSFQMGPMKSTSIKIQSCGTHEEIRLDPSDKIYAVDPIGALNVGAPPKQPIMMHQQPSNANTGDGTGQVIMTVNVADLGSEVISNLKAHHTMITMRMQSSGCNGTNDTTMKMETWTAPIQTYVCPEQFAPSREVSSRGGGGTGGCKITYIMHGDVSGMRDAYSGMIVQMKMYNGDKLMGEQKLVSYSQAALDPSLFQVPADYTKVSDEDFDKAQSKAMMHAMMHGNAFGGGGDQQDNGGNPTPDNRNGSQDNGNGNQGTDNSGDNNTPPPPKKGHSFGGIHLPF